MKHTFKFNTPSMNAPLENKPLCNIYFMSLNYLLRTINSAFSFQISTVQVAIFFPKATLLQGEKVFLIPNFQEYDNRTAREQRMERIYCQQF